MPRSIDIQLVCEIILGPPIIGLEKIDFSYSPFAGAVCEPLGEFLAQNLKVRTMNLAHCG